MPSSPVIVLAAGASERMGQPKGLLSLDGLPWLEWQLRSLLALELAPVVVLGHHREAYASRVPALQRAELVVNEAPERGTYSSVLTGLRNRNAHCFVLPMDVPCAHARVWSSLIGALPGHDAAIPTLEDRGGHPVLLSRALVARLVDGDPSSRLDHELRDAKTTRVPVEDPRVCLNLNTPEAWAEFSEAHRPEGDGTVD